MGFEPRISDYGQQVQSPNFVRASLAKHFARGNLTSTYEFQRVRLVADYWEAVAEQKNFTLTIPFNVEGVLIVSLASRPGTVEGGVDWRFNSAVIRSAPSQVRGKMCIHTITVVGADMVNHP